MSNFFAPAPENEIWICRKCGKRFRLGDGMLKEISLVSIFSIFCGKTVQCPNCKSKDVVHDMSIVH